MRPGPLGQALRAQRLNQEARRLRRLRQDAARPRYRDDQTVDSGVAERTARRLERLGSAAPHITFAGTAKNPIGVTGAEARKVLEAVRGMSSVKKPGLRSAMRRGRY